MQLDPSMYVETNGDSSRAFGGGACQVIEETRARPGETARRLRSLLGACCCIGVSVPTGNLLLQVHAREVCALYACEGDETKWSASARLG
jgi:hypothetical protein